MLTLCVGSANGSLTGQLPRGVPFQVQRREFDQAV